MTRFRANTMASIREPGERPAGSVILCIPIPPSANSIWRSVNGRVLKSGAYKAWITDAGFKVKAQKPIQIVGRVRVDITVARRKNSDIDNKIKAVLDLMQTMGIIENDNLVEEITARWSDEITGAVVIVEAV